MIGCWLEPWHDRCRVQAGRVAADAAILAAAKTVQLPTIRAQAGQLAAAAVKQRLPHKAFLAEVLTAQCDEREARRRIRLVNVAKFPRTKRLADFDHTRIPDLTPAVLAISPRAPGSTPANRLCCSVTRNPVNGGFKQSSQHLDQEVLEWDVRQAGSQRRREGRRCGRRASTGGES